ncbi:BURP domain-containing protein BNM2C-like [Lathyrus oleraceus]|uniref:BURP domain-containing protein BNM2C-like n=1 Tax=Pisum sativum TaxID=3888 RepID=UPI0021CF89A9|nr:BURP domain-containing protein BNM2C-like [Pisum sativum]
MKVRQDLAKSNGKLSSKVDHTEAFKVAFFSLGVLYAGSIMTMQFLIREYAHFWPRKVANDIHFSKSQIPSLLQLFSLTKDFPQGEDMIDMINQCEFKPTKGDTEACPTSLESMLEFDIYSPKWVACHPRPYPYTLYYCHYIYIGSKIFKVLLNGEYGDIMDALGIYHLETSDMNPNHFIFELLGMKYGEAQLSHFFPFKPILWVPRPPHATE